MVGDKLAVPNDSIAGSKQYQKLLADCREITEQARRTELQFMWRLGECISQALADAHSEEWGTHAISSLEHDLVIDRTTLHRCCKLYETFDQASLSDRGHLTWRKVRLLLPIPDPERAELLARLAAGELATDEAFRAALWDVKRKLGLLAPAPLSDQPELFDIKGLHTDTIQRIWRRAKPIERGLALRLLIPHLGLEDVDRRDALSTLRALRAQLDAYETHIATGEPL